MKYCDLDIDELKEIGSEYDKTYVESDIDIDALVSGAAADKDVMDKTAGSYIAMINKIAMVTPVPDSKMGFEEEYKEHLISSETCDSEQNAIKNEEKSQKKKHKFIVTLPPEAAEDDEEDGVSFDEMMKQSASPPFEDEELTDEEAENLRENLLSGTVKRVKRINDAVNMPHPLDGKDYETVKRTLDRKTGGLKISLLLIAISTIALSYLGLSQNLSMLAVPSFVSYSHSIKVFMLSNLCLLGVVFLCSIPILREAVYTIIKRKPGAAFLISTMLFAALAQAVLVIVLPGFTAYSYSAIPAAAIFIYQYYELELTKKVRIDYKLISFKPDKTCGQLVDIEGLSRAVTENDESVTAYVSKIPNIDSCDFFTKAFTKRSYNSFVTIDSCIIFTLAFVLFVVSCIIGTLSDGLTAFIVTIAFTAPVILGVVDKLPFTTLSKKLKLSGASIMGYEAVSKMSQADALIVSDLDIFPSKSLKLCGIKLYNGAEMEEVVVDVASIYNTIKSPMTAVMIEVINSRMELLKEVSEIEYLDERGFSATVDGKLLLIGNADLMAVNLVRIPKDGVADKIKEGGKVPLFIAVDGRLAAIFSLKYTENRFVKRYLKKILATGVKVTVKTCDPNLTQEYICERYYLNKRLVRVLPYRLIESVNDLKPQNGTPPIVTITKDVASYLRAHAATIKIKNLIYINILICIAALVVGGAAAVFLQFVGGFNAATPLSAFVMELWWVVPVALITAFSKAGV
ncbi:MAG: hypothetical protein Q8865_01840 [Bacillota bacterium]|nr:hypothetical protein [Bacillota bacterium]